MANTKKSVKSNKDNAELQETEGVEIIQEEIVITEVVTENTEPVKKEEKPADDFNTKVQNAIDKFTKKCREEYFTPENMAMVKKKVKDCVHTLSTGINAKVTEFKNKKAEEKKNKDNKS